MTRKFYNTAGVGEIVGTSSSDHFFAYLSEGGTLAPDEIRSHLAWSTGILTPAGTYLQIVGQDMLVSWDLIRGSGARDTIFGSAGNDFIAFNNGGTGSGVGGFASIEEFLMGAGDDIVDFSAHGPGGVAFSKDYAVVDGGDGNDQIIGGGGAEFLFGGAGSDFIIGGGDRDEIMGGAGDDILYGDDFGYNRTNASDSMWGEAGDDILHGGKGVDFLAGGEGDDLIYGGIDDDELTGEEGNDFLYGEEGEDDIDGREGDDTIDGGPNWDRLLGGEGNDTITGGIGNDRIYGEDGMDLIFGGDDNDRIEGGAGSDRINGDAGADQLMGGRDADWFIFKGKGALSGTDTILDFEDGTDRIVFEKLGVNRYSEDGGAGSVFAREDGAGGVVLEGVDQHGANFAINIMAAGTPLYANQFSAADFIFA